jgi:hypothetical protein
MIGMELKRITRFRGSFSTNMNRDSYIHEKKNHFLKDYYIGMPTDIHIMV